MSINKSCAFIIGLAKRVIFFRPPTLLEGATIVIRGAPGELVFGLFGQGRIHGFWKDGKKWVARQDDSGT